MIIVDHNDDDDDDNDDDDDYERDVSCTKYNIVKYNTQWNKLRMYRITFMKTKASAAQKGFLGVRALLSIVLFQPAGIGDIYHHHHHQLY